MDSDYESLAIRCDFVTTGLHLGKDEGVVMASGLQSDIHLHLCVNNVLLQHLTLKVFMIILLCFLLVRLAWRSNNRRPRYAQVVDFSERGREKMREEKPHAKEAAMLGFQVG